MKGVLREAQANSGATFSPCKRYRYTLWRRWDESKGDCMFVLLNPSTADAKKDDPTIRRCIGYARDWGYGGIVVTNLFALRSTDPKQLYSAEDPIGPINDSTLHQVARTARRIVFGWGSHGVLHGRSTEVVEMLDRYETYCLGLTKNSEPKHPLYLRKDAQLIGVSMA